MNDQTRSMDPTDVVRSHLAAVSAGDPGAMAADYAPEAVLVRPDATYDGRDTIAAYFATVAGRLAGGQVRFDDPVTDEDGGVVVRWRINGGAADGVSGVDRYVVGGGGIVYQQVQLDADDF
jgi:ketosteroid isomerase-like protein